MFKESRKKKKSTSKTTEEMNSNNSSSPPSSSSSIKNTCNLSVDSNVQTFVVPSEPPQITRMKYEDGKYDLQEIYNRREFARAKVANLDCEIDAYTQSLSNNAIVGQFDHLLFSSGQQKSSLSSSSSSTTSAPEENQVSNQEDQQLLELKKNKKRKFTLVVGTCEDSVKKKK